MISQHEKVKSRKKDQQPLISNEKRKSDTLYEEMDEKKGKKQEKLHGLEATFWI